ncbi:hypothetical protein [Streptomyces litchfieldiae]|uniref:Uncharacterized protein n=1 Tax=Streptomyces litchfieldiae TaxID=3075543 RepID=A0ABU2MM93_9ACTN|nr:hypothetical protein [Streptomyces sp. DSM 44938]MDT0342053.1 hypothetical protein [Streptomyces sp. DSM 44938]
MTKPRGRRRVLLAAAIATAAAATMAAAAPTQAAVGQTPGTVGEAPAAEVPVTAQETIDALTAQLPADLAITGSDGEGLETTDAPYAYLTADDGAGEVSLSLDVYRWATEDWHDIAGCQGWGEPTEGFTCEDTVLPDGSILSLVTTEDAYAGSDEEGDEPYHDITWQAWLESPGGSGLEQPGGRAVVLSESKDLLGLEDPASYAPPLDLDQLAEVVQSPLWQDVLDEADAQYGPPDDGDLPVSDIPSADLRAVFRELAPEGLEITDGTDEDPGYATLQVDDGEGPGLVEITAWEATEGTEEEGMASEDSELVASYEELELVTEDELVAEEAEAEASEPTCEDTTLPDGTTVSACEWPAGEDDPYVLNWVDVVYPDGSSLSVSAVNSPDWETEPVRADAPLSVEELTEIATADQWRALFAA